MSLTKEGLQYIMGFRDTEIIEHDGLKYSSRPIHVIPEVSPEVFTTKTLASVVDLISQEFDNPRLNSLIIHVESPTKVNVFSTLRGNLGRFHLYSAIAELPNLQLNSFKDLEEMNILLKSTFVETELRDSLIALLGNVKEENIRTSSDDGISQTVAAKTGIATVSNVTLPPIVKLAPYRTFVEVEQPEGEFLLRLRNGPTAALFEADGGAWKIQARKNIKKYFEENLDHLVELGSIVITE